MDLHPGTLVVLEGLDATGKTTQMEELNKLFPDGVFTHQPSGTTVVGSVVYQLTEQVKDIEPLARQLLHLASHCEHYQQFIVPTLSDRGIFMDRCWWSTVAYGWFGSRLQYRGIDISQFMEIAQWPTQGVEPTVIFLFLEPFKADPHNTPEVRQGFEHLHLAYKSKVVLVPQLSLKATTTFIIKELRARGLVE